MTPKSEEQPPPSGEERFTSLWDAYAGRVFAYTCRHVDHRSAQEVVSEILLRYRFIQGQSGYEAGPHEATCDAGAGAAVRAELHTADG